MFNYFSISKNELVQFFIKESTIDRLNALLEKFSSKYPNIEIYQQVNSGIGEVGDYLKNDLKKFRTKTENVEIIHAITLADFYFLGGNPLLCFKIKNKTRNKEIIDYKGLLDSINPDTETDVLIKDDQKQFNFQLKQYFEEYNGWSVDEVIQYLKQSILSPDKYNNKNNRDLIITIYIQPKRINTNIHISSDFTEIYNRLAGEDIKLLSINFVVNYNVDFMLWHEVFPRCGHYKIPWQDLSIHQAKIK